MLMEMFVSRGTDRQMRHDNRGQPKRSQDILVCVATSRRGYSSVHSSAVEEETNCEAEFS